MKLLFLLTLFTVLNVSAKTIVIPVQNYQNSDFATNFKTKCVDGDRPSECQALAAVLKTDIMSTLALIEGSSHPDTVALFKEISESKDARLKSYGLTYLAKRLNANDEGLLQSAVNALLSTDYWLGRVAAKILAAANESSYKELGKSYLANQGDQDFETVDGYSRALTNEFFQSITNFFDNAHFPDEVRFIGMDIPLIKPQYNTASLGGKGYIVPGSLSTNAKEIARITGLKPTLGLVDIQPRIMKINEEMMVIAQQMQRGDFSQMGRMTQLQEEMTLLSQAQAVWATELVAYSQMKDVTAFLKFKSGSTSKLEGAIVLKEWPFYKGTSIVYLGNW